MAIYFQIPTSKISADLTDFPVKIVLPADFMDGLGASDWNYLHVTVGGTECYTEVQLWDISTPTAILHSKIASVSSTIDTIIKIEITAVDNYTAGYIGETTEAAAQAVWDSGFAGVWHMKEATTGSQAMKDSTSNERHISTNGGGAREAGPYGDYVINFDGINDWMVTGAFARGAVPVTFEVLISPGNQNHTTGAWIAQQRNAATLNQWQMYYYESSFPGLLNAYVANAGTVRGILHDAGGSEAAGWAFFQMATSGLSGEAYDLWKDAVKVDTVNLSGDIQNASVAMTVGRQGWATSGYYVGLMSEMRLSNVKRSDAWLKATVYSITNDLLEVYESVVATFYTDVAKISEELTNFPVKIVLDSDFMSGLEADDWKYCHVTLDEDELYVEVERWDITEGVAVLYVLIPTLTTSYQTIVVEVNLEDNWIDGSTGYIGEAGEVNAQNVWVSSLFRLVYLMAQDPSGSAPQLIDSSTFENHATSVGTMLTEDLVVGNDGYALDFEGTDDRLISGSAVGISGTSKRSMLVVMKTTDNTNEKQLMSYGALGTGDHYGFEILGSNVLRLALWGGNVAWDAVYADGEYHVLIVTMRGASYLDNECWMDGVELSVNSSSSVTISTTDSAMSIAARIVDFAIPFEGSIATAMFLSDEVSDGWIVAMSASLLNTLLLDTPPAGSVTPPYGSIMARGKTREVTSLKICMNGQWLEASSIVVVRDGGWKAPS